MAKCSEKMLLSMLTMMLLSMMLLMMMRKEEGRPCRVEAHGRGGRGGCIIFYSRSFIILRSCTSATLLTSPAAACRRPVSFLRLWHPGVTCNVDSARIIPRSWFHAL